MSHHRPITVAVLLLAMAAAAPARAAGVNLSWNECASEAGSARDATFACDTNGGSHTMVGSFVLDSAFPAVIGMEVVMDVAAASSVLPAWWDFGPFDGSARQLSACRNGSLSASLAAGANDAVCADWAQGTAMGGVAAWCGSNGSCVDHPASANSVRFKLATAVSIFTPHDLAGGTEYEVFRLTFNHARTSGSDACGGCATPVCLVLGSVRVVDRGDVNPRLLTLAVTPGSNTIAWQGGGGLAVGDVGTCPATSTPTPAKRSSWGAVKALYR